MKQKEITDAHILQIMPALPGCEAVWADPIETYEVEEIAEEDDQGYNTEPIVCWALVETKYERRCVVALLANGPSSELKLIDDDEYFLGYSIPHTEAHEWKDAASFRRKMIREQEEKDKQKRQTSKK